ncbi:MAG: HDOD domain-containing protein [Methylococcaceae bacterium]|nr:HDOD domain-containing protein [Methylococcaceae bacterium]
METVTHSNKDITETISKNKFVRLAELPSLPALLMEALREINDSQDIGILADKIGQDPPLVARLLRIANSPFYGMSREIGTLREAIHLLGINRVRHMLLGICFPSMLPVPHKDFDYTTFWHHSMVVADCTRQLANATGIDRDSAFTAGLLHDIGRLIIVFLYPGEFSKIAAQSDQPLMLAERQVLSFDHMEIGGKAAQYWNLPIAIQESIELHETPPEPNDTKSLASLVYVANLLAIESKQQNESSLAREEAIRLTLDIHHIPLDKAALFVDAAKQFADQVVAAV